MPSLLPSFSTLWITTKVRMLSPVNRLYIYTHNTANSFLFIYLSNSIPSGAVCFSLSQKTAGNPLDKDET